jgi:DNA-binding MarR family transcriptional regulator
MGFFEALCRYLRSIEKEKNGARIFDAELLQYVYFNVDPTYGDLMDELNTTNASISRATKRLGGVSRNDDKPGYGLVVVTKDPTEGRRNQVRLSSMGLSAMRYVEQCTKA